HPSLAVVADQAVVVDEQHVQRDDKCPGVPCHTASSRDWHVTSPPCLSATAAAPIVTGNERLEPAGTRQARARVAMDGTRRDFFTLIAIAGGLHASSPAALARALEPRALLEFESLGNVTLLHMTDPHGTVLPVYYREPDTKIGVGDEAGRP